MTQVVIVGAGIAGVPAAYGIKNRLGPSGDVTVVSDKDYFHFVPSNPWVAMGWREQAEIAFPIAPCLEERGIKFVGKGARAIDPDRNQIELTDGSTLKYDYLLLATGPEAAFDEIEGIGSHTYSVIHIEHAIKAHEAYKQFVKNPGPIVIGAAQGSSILGPIYEFAFLVDADLRRRNIRDRVPITLVTPEPFPGHLGIGATGDTRRLLEDALKDRNIQVVANARTVRVETGKVHIMECDAQGKDKQAQELPFAFSVYWPAFRGVGPVRSCAGLTDERGFVQVDEYLRSTKSRNIFAVGVCRAHAVVEKTPLHVGAPESVFSIQSDVDTAVRNIVAMARDEELASAVPRRAQWLSDMGEMGAAYLSAPQVPLRNINWLKQGKWVHLAKVDFEKYFINKIKLKPAGQVPGVASDVATVINRMQTEKMEGPKVRPIAQPVGRPFGVPLSMEATYEMRAMAQALGKSADLLASELLGAALRDAKSYLSAAMLDDVERERREILISELPENQPGVEFHGGGT